MTNQINPRIVTVGIQVGTSVAVGPPSPSTDFQLFEGLDIRASGQKFAGTESDTCTLQISNLTRAQKNWLLTTASPLTTSQQPSRRPILVTLSVGRENVFQPFVLFQGYCWASAVSMAPDISITLSSTTNNLQAAALQPQPFGALTDMHTIASQIAAQYKLNLNWDPTIVSKQIANFQYTGGLQKAINKLSRLGNIRVNATNTTLNVWNVGGFCAGTQPFTLSTSTGMVGIPEVTEMGIKAMALIQPGIQIGGQILVQSSVNPSIANQQQLYVSSLNYHVTNRDDPFWYEIFCATNQGLQPAQ